MPGEEFPLLCWGQADDAAAGSYARVAEHDVYAAEGFHRLAHAGAHLVVERDIRADGNALDIVGVEIALGGGETFVIDKKKM